MWNSLTEKRETICVSRLLDEHGTPLLVYLPAGIGRLVSVEVVTTLSDSTPLRIGSPTDSPKSETPPACPT